ncbi:MAG: dihydrolipoamide acetyltransferase family protein [Chloroflexota bacterium]
MSTEVVMPRLSDTMESGTVARWLKHEGDAVQRGEVIAEIETDKANMELESYASGILARIVVGEGQSVLLGEPIALIAATEQEAHDLQAGQPAGEAVPAKRSSATTTAAAPARDDSGEPGNRGNAPAVRSQPGRPEPDGDGRIKASPLARRLAHEHEIDLVEVEGTGPGGRITRDDVQSILKREGVPATAREATSAVPRTRETQLPTEGAGGRGSHPIEMTRMRQTIARRLTEARFGAPDFLLTAEYDMTSARELLAQIASGDSAPRIGPNDLLVRATALALAQHPGANAGWENDSIIRYGNINIGIAVATENGGLVVPVIRDAATKTLGQISKEAKQLIQKARSGKLAPAEREGGTFTISNLGMYDIDQFTSILNPPEACSLAVGAISRQPVVVGSEIAIRDRMRVTLTCDHRVINGAEGAEFLQALRGFLENPWLAVL